MKSFFILSITVAVVGMLTVCVGWCHGVDGNVERIEAFCITAMYDDGAPMSYAAVEIKAPDSDIEFQTGRTDRNGYFMVKPDTPGAWQAVVSDGMGHQLALDFTVAADQENARQAEEKGDRRTAHPVSRSMGATAGLSIIFGLCGVLYGWRVRKKQGT